MLESTMCPEILPALICGVFVGEPESLTDDGGTWVSSIRREEVLGPVQVTSTGLVGDRATQPYHGGPGAAICVHMADHYSFWKLNYGMNLHAGSVGENITLDQITEDQICVGDIVRLGTSLLQVSGPRVPCANQARHLGRADWVKLTISENRTGFYLRVLEPGTLQAGDLWQLQERVHPDGQIPAINRCMYHAFDPDCARKLIGMSALEEWWKFQFQEKLANRDHWTASVIND